MKLPKRITALGRKLLNTALIFLLKVRCYLTSFSLLNLSNFFLKNVWCYLTLPMNIISKNSCQFFLSDEEAMVVRNITKVDALSTAAKSIVRKAIDAYLRKRKSKVRQ